MGVMPDAGFEIKLSESETYALMMDRRAHDILQPPPAKDAATAKKLAQAGKPAFVDHQLEAAVKYLTTELAKAQ